jgi:hypothetical protein
MGGEIRGVSVLCLTCSDSYVGGAVRGSGCKGSRTQAMLQGPRPAHCSAVQCMLASTSGK